MKVNCYGDNGTRAKIIFNKTEHMQMHIKQYVIHIFNFVINLQRWVWAYRSKQFHVKVNTNNGLKRQNRTLKHDFLQPYRDSSLTGLTTVIVEQYLPDAWLK